MKNLDDLEMAVSECYNRRLLELIPTVGLEPYSFRVEWDIVGVSPYVYIRSTRNRGMVELEGCAAIALAEELGLQGAGF
jgi:hypothetical protein